jgi:hypothetical protein
MFPVMLTHLYLFYIYSIQELCLSRTKVTDVGILAIAENLPGLRLLDVSHNEGVSDLSISAVASRCLSLVVRNKLLSTVPILVLECLR